MLTIKAIPRNNYKSYVLTLAEAENLKLSEIYTEIQSRNNCVGDPEFEVLIEGGSSLAGTIKKEGNEKNIGFKFIGENKNLDTGVFLYFNDITINNLIKYIGG